MTLFEDKENLAPLSPHHAEQNPKSSSSKSLNREGRSKSNVLGGIEGPDTPQDDTNDRRKSLSVSMAKGILPSKEDTERKAARRKSMANRRVSFAPEATLHTWDVIEYMRDHTTSTESPESTRRASSASRQSAAHGSSPGHRPTSPGADTEENSVGDAGLQEDLEDSLSMDSASDTGDESGSDSESEGEVDEDSDETETAMSLDMGEETAQSISESETSSTSSSAQLARNLRTAADTAGTRGIEYDEYGEMSMELAGEEVTNAFKPWADQNDKERRGSASFDQENVNPFMSTSKSRSTASKAAPLSIVEENEEDDEQDVSMDVTRAVGGVLRAHTTKMLSSPSGEGTMDFTQAVGRIQIHSSSASTQLRSGQKRRRSTSAAGSPGVDMPAAAPKRRRSSTARSVSGEEEMEFTTAVGGIKDGSSPKELDRREIAQQSRDVESEQGDATMDLTRPVGSTHIRKRLSEESFDGNEELSMELTTVIGGLKDTPNDQDSTQDSPQRDSTSIRSPPVATPDQHEDGIAVDSGSRKLLTPTIQPHASPSPRRSPSRSRQSISPVKESKTIAEPASPILRRSVRQSSARKSLVSTPSIHVDSPEVISYPDLSANPSTNVEPSPSLEETTATSPQTTPRTPQPLPSSRTEAASDVLELTPAAQVQAHSQGSPFQEHLSPSRLARTPPNIIKSAKALANSIMLMSTPRKEVLKNVSPKKQTPVRMPSPAKRMPSTTRPTPKSNVKVVGSPARQLSEDLARTSDTGELSTHVHLQQFLDEAGIRFMDLTTTKRRLTTAPTPSRVHKTDADGEDASDDGITLESALVAAACIEPELELFKHACHELKRYIDEGKFDIKALETETYKETPPLVQAYMSATSERRAVIDAQMRSIKTNARLRSKEVWYGWRSNLVDDLMHALQGIAEGLLNDDDVLLRQEDLIAEVLPSLIDQQADLEVEVKSLKASALSNLPEEKEDLDAARKHLVSIETELEVKRKELEELQQHILEQEANAESLQEMKTEFNAAIQEADRMREACRTVSTDEIRVLRDSAKKLEEEHGWSITSAATDPTTVTMAYKSQVELYFHPGAFMRGDAIRGGSANAPIRLSYSGHSESLPTIQRFFLQLLRASLHTLQQSSTTVTNLLHLISSGWDQALAVSQSAQSLSIEGPTDIRILSDERLSVSTSILLPQVRTKVRASYELVPSIGEELGLEAVIETNVRVVYGEPYNEKNMSEFLGSRVVGSVDGWSSAVCELRKKLVARGPKAKKDVP